MSKSVPLDRASAQQMRDFARGILGLPVDDNASPSILRAQIAQANPELTEIIVLENEPAIEPVSEPHVTASVMEKEDKTSIRVRVRVMAGNGKGGKEPVPVGVNGSVMLVPREQEVIIPYAFYEVLTNAVQMEYDVNPDMTIDMNGREVMMFPVQFLGFAKQAAA